MVKDLNKQYTFLVMHNFPYYFSVISHLKSTQKPKRNIFITAHTKVPKCVKILARITYLPLEVEEFHNRCTTIRLSDVIVRSSPLSYPPTCNESELFFNM